jgi:hypothetical protein
MPLLNEHLTVWEISLRWAGLDPSRQWFRLPLPARDNARMLTDAILRLHLHCLTLSVEKWSSESGTPPEFFVRHHLTDIEGCIAGRRFPRRLLQWALIDRWDMYLWCQRQGAPLPEFWFPAGWHLSYRWPEEPQRYDLSGVPAELAAAGEPRFERMSSIAGITHFEKVDSMERDHPPQGEPAPSGDETLRTNQRARIACQVVATSLWKNEPEATIASMVKHPAIQQLCSGSHYDDETIREWIKVVAPDAVRQKRGRPPKKNPPES